MMNGIDKGKRFASKITLLREKRSIARSSIFQALWWLDKISINAPADTYCEYLDSEIEINSSDRECNACTGESSNILRGQNSFEYQRQSKIDISALPYIRRGGRVEQKETAD